MNGILGFAQLLKEPDLSGDEQQNYIRIIEKSGTRMLNLINDIVDISKIESGQMEISLSDSNINEQIQFIYTILKPEAELHGINLFMKNTLPSEMAMIRTDHAKFYAILTNLVKNAIKYTKSGFVEFGCNKKDNCLEFFVKDTGIGIPKDRQEAIFQRFIHADVSNKHALDGAGLGLSIAKAYVDMLSGKIWVESEPGVGSTFYFTIPYKNDTKEKSIMNNVNLSSETENHTADLKILIAEDDETSFALLKRMLKIYSRECIHTVTGAETLEVYRNTPDLDLIFMDIRMPDINGYEATQQIRQENKDIVIIAQTAFALAGDREKAIAAGCNDYVTKPILKAELSRVLNTYFSH
jgi:CheY-like chemotaxis protein